MEPCPGEFQTDDVEDVLNICCWEVVAHWSFKLHTRFGPSICQYVMPFVTLDRFYTVLMNKQKSGVITVKHLISRTEGTLGYKRQILCFAVREQAGCSTTPPGQSWHDDVEFANAL